MTIKVSTLKNGKVRLRVMTIRPNTLLASWYQLEDTIEKNKFEWENIAKSKSILTKYGKMIFVRDMWKQWYINGINQKIDSVEKVIEFLRTETENMRVTTVGNSSGGYMATLVAQKLNAKMAYCVSGQFDIADQISRQPVVRKAAEENYKYIIIMNGYFCRTLDGQFLWNLTLPYKSSFL